MCNHLDEQATPPCRTVFSRPRGKRTTPVPERLPHPGLEACRIRSIELLKDLAETTRAQQPVFLTLAAAGSLGRLEAGPDSDFDSLFIVPDKALAAPDTDQTVREAIAAVFARARECGLAVPKADGIFRAAITPASLVDPAALGSLDESPATFGRRMQLLLDARPIFGVDAFCQLRAGVLDWYCSPARSLPAEAPWDYLQGDLVRYAHAYRNWQSFRHARTAEDSWALRQAKLRLVRYVTWMGLYLLVAEARAMGGQAEAWLLSRLELTPLERIVHVLEGEAPQAAARIVEAYGEGLVLLHDPAVRRALIASTAPDTVQLPPALVRIIELADAIREALQEFMVARCVNDPRRALPF